MASICNLWQKENFLRGIRVRTMYPIYCLESDLMADLFKQTPQFLLELVDWKANAEATSDHVSKIPEMHKLNQAFARLGASMPSKKQPTQINTRHVVTILHITSMHLITNHSHKSVNFQ